MQPETGLCLSYCPIGYQTSSNECLGVKVN